MTIHDELILELIKPNRHGEVGDKALIVRVVGTKKIEYKLEEPTEYPEYYELIGSSKETIVKITPDITIVLPKEDIKEIAIELENDVHWDFGESLRQVKKYKCRFGDVRVIIPKEYERFAPLYKNEGFRVWLWNTTRIWQCNKCKSITEKEGPFEPKCKKCKKYTKHRLIGLKDTEIKEYK